MPIPKSDRDVLLDVPQWLLKKMAKVEPSPVVGGDGEGVYYVGKFSNTWAPDDLRNREFYYVHAKAIFSPEAGGSASRCLSVAFGDPLFSFHAETLSTVFFENMCGPASTSTTWANCIDPQYEESCSAYIKAVVSNKTYGKCYAAAYGPAMFVFSAAPAIEYDMNNLVAYSKPCPVYSSTPSLSGKNEMSGQTLIRAVGCDDSANKVNYVRYTSEDRSSASYTIAYLGMGVIVDANSISTWMRYGLSSSVVKNANDYYYYIYTVGFQYQ
jgi:hypothetical protein